MTAHDVLNVIREDMRRDIKAFEGRALSGAVVAEIHGNLAAAIATLAEVVTSLLPAPEPGMPPATWGDLRVVWLTSDSGGEVVVVDERLSRPVLRLSPQDALALSADLAAQVRDVLMAGVA